jgi:tetratricopeptide (TPR) repeat protein
VAACDEALKLLPRKRSLRPEEVEIYRAKAEALLATRSEGEVPDEDTQRREREALLALQQYVKQQGPPAAEVFRTMGMLHSRRRQIPEAINAFQQALELQLDSATFTARGWAYLASEDDRAMADFAEAIRLDEKNQNAGAYAGRGLIHARQGRPAEASADAKRALKLSGENPRFLLLWNVAHVYAQNAAGAAAKGLRRDFFDNRDLALDVLEAAFRNALPEQRRKLWAEYIAQDGLLAALRDSDRFARLENAYHQKTPKSANK